MERIRKVEDRDAREIAEIYNHYVRETTVTFVMEPISTEEMAANIKAICKEGPYFVMDDGERVIGFCYAHKWKSKAAYDKTFEVTIYLRPGFEGKGRGQLLMETLIRESRKRGVHALISCITQENDGSCRFHERLGFEKVSHFREVGRKFGRWLDVMDYELVIAES